jgi:hypothetical protein
MIFGTRPPPCCSSKASIFRRSRTCWYSSIGVTSAIYVDVLREVQRDAVDRLSDLVDTDNGPDALPQVRSGLRSGGSYEIGPSVVAAPRVELEPTTLRLTDAGRPLTGSRHVGIRSVGWCPARTR